MDNAEQSPRGPSKGIFDTASLLAPSPTLFSSRPPTPVQSPLPHLTHSPSAFSVLGRNAVLVPPPSSNSDSSPSPGSGKICSPIMHHSASDALSSLASSSGCRAIFMHERHQKKFKGEGRKSQRCADLVSLAGAGPCSWWSAGSPIANNPDFVGCGVVPLTDPYGRAGICGRSSVSPAHLTVPQPRRNEFVEEVLGHLYAKPPSAETKVDVQTSGIPSPQQTICKSNSLATSLIGVSSKKSSKVKYSEKDNTHGKSMENSAPALSLLCDASTTSGNQLTKPTSKQSADSVNEQIARLFSTPEKVSLVKHKKQSKSSKPDAAKNGKKSRSDKKQSRKLKEKKVKNSSSESEGHVDSSCSSTGAESSGAVSSSSSESSDEEEREKQQKELARLKKQQQELRRKVQELKQASHENVHPKPELNVKKITPNPKNSLPPSGSLNHVPKLVPSPAHSASSITPPSPKIISPIAKATNIIIEEEQNSAFPLDLCMKRQEPTFEVSSSAVTSSFASSSIPAKKKQSLPAVPSLPGAKTSTPKRRGRKPKPVQLSGAPAVSQPSRARQKKHSVKDITGLMPPKLLDGFPGHISNSSAIKSGSSSNSSILSKATSILSNNATDILPPTKRNFTLDSLLGETNGTIDSILQFPENEVGMFPGSSLGNRSSKSKDRQRAGNRAKKFEDRPKDPEPRSFDYSSLSDSDPDNEDSSSEDTEHSRSGSLIDSASGSRRKHKHSYDEDSEDSRSKRRRVLPDERECQIPLEHGWRRETRVRCFSRSGVRGEVAYYAPCGKKLRSYPEVVRYLIKNGIVDISRDNFTFSTKMNVGEFLESSSSGSGQDYVLLTEQEVAARIEEAKGRRGRLGVQHRKSSQQRCAEEEEQQRQWEQKQLQHHLEQQAEESRKQKEQQRLIKQQEKFERLEQLRVEREIRAQQLLEEQEMKRQQAVFIREQEMQKRREMLLMVDLERERRRQHMILVRALENRKKQEERERKREEILYEKRINREKKMEQRRIELDYLRELKKPVEDMMLKDTIPLPTLNRIPGVKLPGKAFADALMVFEFLHNFGETLGFDMESLPSLNTLQMALLSLDEKCEEELLSVLHHLLVCAIEDPGVPHNSESSTILGQSLKDADITNSNVSEVLRLYFIAQDKWGNILEWLQAKPFLALNATQKAEIIAYLCDELLTSRLLTRQIDSNIENVNVLRKDKWLVEGDLRRYRSIQQRRALKARLSAMEENKEDPNSSNIQSDVSELCDSKGNQSGIHDSDLKDLSKSDKEKLDDMENELANESGNESDDTQAPAQISDGEDEFLHLSNEEVCKKIEKLSKQLTGCSNRLTKAFYTIRGATFGMDRYHRRYWVLPKSGGVFIESMESSLKVKEQEAVLSASRETSDNKEKSSNVEDEMNDENSKEESNIKKENADHSKELFDESTTSNINELSKQDSTEDLNAVVKMEIESENTAETKHDVEIEEQVEIMKDTVIKASTSVKDVCDESLEDQVSKKSSELQSNEIDSKISEARDICNDVLAPEKPPELNDCHSDEKDNEKESSSPLEKKDKDQKCISPQKENGIFKNIFLDQTESDRKGTLQKTSHNESKNSSPSKTKDMEIKDILRMKSSSDIKSFPSLKKEAEIKIKSEDKKESKNKDFDSKMHCKMGDIKDEKKVNIFMPNLCDSNVGLDIGAPKLHGSTDRQHTPSPSIPPDQNWLLHSPLFASILAGNMLFNGPMMPPRDVNGTYFNLPKNDSNNPFGPFLQPGMLSAEQIFKSIGDNKPNNQKPWFSILPRMPCDESLIGSPQISRNSTLHSPANLASPNHPRTSAPPAQAGHHVASALSNLQMELLNGVPPGFFLHPFMPHQFGPTYQPSPPATCSSHQSSFTSTLTHTSPMLDFNLNFGCPPKSSTPNSIPTPSATPGPTSRGCATPTSRDSPSPCFAKRLMMEKLTQEYEAPQPISPELQRGWWRVTDPSQLSALLSAFHHRGVREKMIQKQLQKHFTFACTSCTQGQDTDLEITDLDRQISGLVGGAPAAEDAESWSRDIALRVDMAILEQVENLEEKVDGASMQVKGWKPPPKLSIEPISKFVPACELYLQWKGSDFRDSIKGKSPKKGKKSQYRKKKPTEPKKKDSEDANDDPDKKEDDKGEVLAETSEFLELADVAIEEQEKLNSEEPKKEGDMLPLPPGKLNPVEEAKMRLLKVEAAIEKRYLRPPLGSSPNELTRSALSNNGGGSSSQISSETPEEDFVPIGLVKWRNSVQACRTSSQLAMCVNFLETCTAWDKSIMRASCQFCHSGDNEEKLLLCDGCDKGYHTYCFKPVMDAIPDGDWYCYECLNKATGDNVCVICGTKGKLVECETCPKTFHLNCLDPPLAKMPKGKWYCSGCNLTRPKKSKKSTSTKEKESSKEPKEGSTSKKSESGQTPKSKTAEKKEKKEKNLIIGNKDLAPCSLVVSEMEKHDDAWPFLTPVNTKQFPTYKKVIKKPMDLATIRNRLESGQYKCREDFAADTRLIFDNCETFNEDDSPVGQAGHSMRAYFETRWAELNTT